MFKFLERVLSTVILLVPISHWIATDLHGCGRPNEVGLISRFLRPKDPGVQPFVTTCLPL